MKKHMENEAESTAIYGHLKFRNRIIHKGIKGSVYWNYYMILRLARSWRRINQLSLGLRATNYKSLDSLMIALPM